jgi:hypothetical protein
MKIWTLLVLLVVLAVARRADAYPQFQLSRDVTCTSCHIAPDGGGLLNENGMVTAETIAWKDHDPAFMYGMPTPDWLQLGGDVRGAGGFVDPGVASAAFYPMQAELAARVASHGFSAYAVGGLRRPNEDAGAVHVLWSREHYLMWQQRDDGQGLFVRAGRLMPTYGLRLAEHVVYTQRFGGRPLYYEAYALAASYVKPAYEVHATGFVHDPIASSPEHGDGGALYAEARIGTRAAIGVEGKYSAGDDETHTFAGATGKLYLAGLDVLLLGEAEWIRQHVTAGAGDTRDGIAAYVMASRPLPYGLLLDVGVGHYTQDTRVQGLYRDAIDANVHWFMTSHIEWLLTTRLELLDGGSGPNGGFVLAQLHYRL